MARDEKDDVVVLIDEAARLAGYAGRQGFLLRVAVTGGLRVRRAGVGGTAPVYFFRDELVAWIEANPGKLKTGRKPKAKAA